MGQIEPGLVTVRESRHQDVLYTFVQLVGANSKRTPQWLAEGFHPKGHVHRTVL